MEQATNRTRRIPAITLTAIALFLFGAATDDASAQRTGSSIRAEAVIRVMSGVSDWIENNDTYAAASAYHAAWGNDCTVSERPAFGRTATAWWTAQVFESTSENACGTATTSSKAIRYYASSTARGSTSPDATCSVFTLHNPRDIHQAMARAWASVEGDIAIDFSSGAAPPQDDRESVSSGSSTFTEWPEGTVLAIAYVDTLQLLIDAGSPEVSSFESKLTIDGVDIWSATLELRGDGSVETDGAIPEEAYSVTYDSVEETWTLDLLGFSSETPIMTLESGESDELSLVFESNASAAATLVGNELPPAIPLSLEQVRQNNPDGEPEFMGELVQIQTQGNPLLVVSDAASFLPILDTDVTDGQFGLGLLDPFRDVQPGEIQPGDEVQIQGWVSHSNGRTVLMNPEIQVLNTGWNVMPFPAMIPEIMQFGEQLEGLPLLLEQVELVDPQQWPAPFEDGLVDITDGFEQAQLFISGFNWPGMQAPNGPFDLVAVLSQNDEQNPFDENYRLRLRGPEDVMLQSTEVGDDDGAELSTNEPQMQLSSYPNPAINDATFQFAMPASGHVKLTVHDVRGRQVATLVDGPQDEGPHSVRWDRVDSSGQTLPSGIYFGRLLIDGNESRNKLVLVD